MNFHELNKKILKNDPIARIFEYCLKENGQIDTDKLEKYLKKLVKNGKLIN
jgi:hypothetical protein